MNIRNVIYQVLLFCIIGLSACNSAKQVPYFQDVPDSLNTFKYVPNTPYAESIIHKGDLLNIEITTLESDLSGGVATESQGKRQDGGSADAIKGYLVDKFGMIEMPIVGKLKVEGLTTYEVKELVRKHALKYYKDPLVNVRVANFVITIIGEVGQPGRYVIPSGQINIIDAVGLAGDLKITGKRRNVMIMREENGETVFTRVDLNSTDVFHSKYFHLQSGDKIYVEPLKITARSGTADQSLRGILSITLSLMSITLAAYSIFRR